mmetsp:Transcript_52207/g.124451  ORF Transcript_52207/g.124451 Transcript_52207/m.124451 type:complete len:514 (+) Transcript_52207:117-1658(+)|eukprot:CAMPEP_0178405930 /NCGR_PEP_ID=MMETSP0689_2-20121128/18653_1 /TAXON_ID=160604 /ORGANISM="Amphidinium massartii, Strain CS-259" /LENGTH=513 /DNA_ID=CAMNT_0020026961 /DNA_START=39 /DNA_END=1580 /DNA_ORIENTATION=+
MVSKAWLLWCGCLSSWRPSLAKWVSFEDDADHQHDSHEDTLKRVLSGSHSISLDAHAQGLEHEHSFLLKDKVEPVSAAQIQSNSSASWTVSFQAEPFVRDIFKVLSKDEEDFVWKWYNHDEELADYHLIKGSFIGEKSDVVYPMTWAAPTPNEALANHMLLFHGMAPILASRSDSTFAAFKQAVDTDDNDKQGDEELDSHYIARLLTMYANRVGGYPKRDPNDDSEFWGLKRRLMDLPLSALRHIHAHDHWEHRAFPWVLFPDTVPEPVPKPVVDVDDTTEDAPKIEKVHYREFQGLTSPCTHLFMKEFLGLTEDSEMESKARYTSFRREFTAVGEEEIQDWAKDNHISLPSTWWDRFEKEFLGSKMVGPRQESISRIKLATEKGGDVFESKTFYLIAGEMQMEIGYTAKFAVPIHRVQWYSFKSALKEGGDARDAAIKGMWDKVHEWETRMKEAKGGVLETHGPDLWAYEMSEFYTKSFKSFAGKSTTPCSHAWWPDPPSDSSVDDTDGTER